METCGPANPLQNLGKQLGTDSSLQRERAGPQATPQERFRGTRRVADNAQFEHFATARGAPALGGPFADFGWDAVASGTPEAAVAQGQHLGPRAAAAAGEADWVAQFSHMNVNPTTAAQQPQHGQHAPWQASAPAARERRFIDPAMFAANFGGLNGQQSRAIGSGGHFAQLGQVPAAPAQAAQADAFEKAFAEVESRIHTVSSTLAPEETAEATATGKSGENLSGVAQSVLRTVAATTASDSVAAKFRKSEFFSLMEKFGSGQLVVQDDTVVAGAAPAVAAPVISEHTTNNDAAAATRDTRDFPAFVGPRAPEVRVPTPAYNPQVMAPGLEAPLLNMSPVVPLSDPKQGQQPLEDPFAYLQRLRQGGDRANAGESRDGDPAGPLDPAGGVLSAFEAARQFGGVPVREADWEEQYDEAVWYGGPPGEY